MKRVPRVGEVIYLNGNDDATGGLAIVSRVVGTMVSVEMSPCISSNWDILQEFQHRLAGYTLWASRFERPVELNQYTAEELRIELRRITTSAARKFGMEELPPLPPN